MLCSSIHQRMTVKAISALTVIWVWVWVIQVHMICQESGAGGLTCHHPLLATAALNAATTAVPAATKPEPGGRSFRHILNHIRDEGGVVTTICSLETGWLLLCSDYSY